MDGLFVPIINDIMFKSVNDTKTLLHIGDTHFGHPGHCANRWQKFKDRYKNRKDVLAIGMGDYWDFSRWSDRKAMRRGGVSDSARDWMDSKVTDDIKRAADELSQFQWLGMLEGNHDWVFSNGETASERLATELGTKYLGTCAYVYHRLNLHGGYAHVAHVAHHGTTSGAKTVLGSINALEHWSKAFQAHIYAMGHDHSSFVLPCSYTPLFGRINRQTGDIEILEHESWFVRSGSMLRGYVPNQRSYIATKAMPARRLSYPEIRIGVTRYIEDGVRRLKPTIEGVNPSSYS